MHTHASKTLKRLLRNMPLTLTCSSEGPPILKKKYPGLGWFLVRGEPPPKKKLNFFFQKCFNIFKQFFFSKFFFFFVSVRIYMKDPEFLTQIIPILDEFSR